jgi:hypothetical protein
MHRAFPGSEYYGDSAPPTPSVGIAPIHRPSPLAEEQRWNVREWFPRSLVSGRRVRHPALPLRYRHGYCRRPFTMASKPKPTRPDLEFPGPNNDGRVRAANQPESTGLELASCQEA